MTHLVLSLRSSLATSLLGLAVLTAAAPGCSSSDDTSSSDSAKKKDIYAEKRPPVLVNEAVNADQAFADDAVVADD
jgi:hypothetical protein